MKSVGNVQRWKMKSLLIVFLFLHTEGLLYPYGPSTDKVTPKSDDGVSPPIPAIVPLFGKNYSSIYVNNNGVLSFDEALGSSAPQPLPIATTVPFLAPFWADVNNEISGNIYYRLSSDSELLNMTENYMSRYFPEVLFSPKWVFVATWDKVPYYGSTTNKVNTFQAVLSTDENSTFIMFNYGDIQWPAGNEGPPAVAGCNSGVAKGFFEIPGSFTADMINITHTSNVNFPGHWVFKVDQVEVESPINNTDITSSPTPTKMYLTSQKVTDVPSTNYTTHNTKVISPSLGSSSSATTITVPYTTRVHACLGSHRNGNANKLSYLDYDGPADLRSCVTDGRSLPYGNSTPDEVTERRYCGVSPPIHVTVLLFGEIYTTIYVNNNGLLSFDVELGNSSVLPLCVAKMGPFLAPFWTDVDNEVSGNIYYRLSNDSELLNMLKKYISSYFPEVPFSPDWVLVATWDKVSYFGSKTNKVNTFQAALSTDMKSTFVMFNYIDIQWPTGKENEGPPAVAGYNSGFSGGCFEIPGSLTADIINIINSSNVNLTGRWVFRVDRVEVGSPTMNPGQHSTTRVSPSPPNTSPQTSTVTNATSQPTPPGLSSANTESPVASNTTNGGRDEASTVPSSETLKTTSTASKLSTSGFFFICFTAFIVLF